MSLQLNTPPAEEPVSLATAKAYLKVDTSDDDALISSLISAARARAEWHTGRAFVTQGWTLWLDHLAGTACAEIPLSPLQSVTSVTLYAPDGGSRVLGASDYFIDAMVQPWRLCFTVPLTDLRPCNGIAIAFIAGYGDATAVPPPLVTAILVMVASLYANRGDELTPTPQTAIALMAPYRQVHL